MYWRNHQGHHILIFISSLSPHQYNYYIWIAYSCRNDKQTKKENWKKKKMKNEKRNDSIWFVLIITFHLIWLWKLAPKHEVNVCCLLMLFLTISGNLQKKYILFFVCIYQMVREDMRSCGCGCGSVLEIVHHKFTVYLIFRLKLCERLKYIFTVVDFRLQMVGTIW